MKKWEGGIGEYLCFSGEAKKIRGPDCSTSSYQE